ncbi:hypothetical protein CYMTET_21287 [Cymbomonas tetramitiformis]|uniref:Uncharacterized protein n=1 Tax=Cymbomonas tetramitiformis TaxID=36881 RepID=A0AAE0G2H4_9CHLO|nr:hypothetical protein CYMTET_21287 [Cymbomonas tetramitiformis]
MKRTAVKAGLPESVEDVCRFFLHECPFMDIGKQVSEKVREAGVDGEVLATMTENELKEELGLENVNLRRKVHRRISQFFSKDGQRTTDAQSSAILETPQQPVQGNGKAALSSSNTSAAVSEAVQPALAPQADAPKLKGSALNVPGSAVAAATTRTPRSSWSPSSSGCAASTSAIQRNPLPSSAKVASASLGQPNGQQASAKIAPAISFSTGKSAVVPLGWHTEGAGRAAAEFTGGTPAESKLCSEGYPHANRERAWDTFRLVGSVCITVTAREGAQAAASTAKQLLTPRCPTKRKNNRKMPMPWSVNGEPTGRQGEQTVTAGTLLTAVQRGQLLCKEPWAEQWLEAVDVYSHPSGNWHCPFVRGECRPDPQQLELGLQAGTPLSLEFHLYFGRLIFYLIADDPIAHMLRPLTPAADTIPVHTRPPSLQVFQSTRSELHPFSLPGILRSQEHRGYLPALQPPGLALSLKEYQLHTLQWMLDQEAMPRGLNSLFWEERQWPDGTGCFYYSAALGELRLEPPPLVRGGLLCEEMGLGKTLEVVALIVASRQPAEVARRAALPRPTARRPEEEKGTLISSDATLVVAPDTLVSQWLAEVAKSCAAGACQLATRAHVNSAPTKREHMSAVRTRAQALAQGVDVVVTTYRTVECDPALQQVRWARVCLDEMQEIRSSGTRVAQLCEKLAAEARWMVSGTPLYTGIDDLNGELNFLGVIPFCLRDAEDGFWGLKVKQAYSNGDPEALERLELLLSGVMMRHSKSQVYHAEPRRSLLALPRAEQALVPVAWASKHEAAAYANLEVVAARASTATGGRDLAPRAVSLLRNGAISMNMVGGGQGCPTLLKDLDAMLRETMALGQGRGTRHGQGGSLQEEGVFASMPADRLRDYLMMAGRQHSHSSGAGVGLSAAVLRERNASRLTDATSRLAAAEQVWEGRRAGTKPLGALGVASSLPMTRWQWAVQAVTSGKYFALLMAQRRWGETLRGGVGDGCPSMWRRALRILRLLAPLARCSRLELKQQSEVEAMTAQQLLTLMGRKFRVEEVEEEVMDGLAQTRQVVWVHMGVDPDTKEDLRERDFHRDPQIGWRDKAQRHVLRLLQGAEEGASREAEVLAERAEELGCALTVSPGQAAAKQAAREGFRWGPAPGLTRTAACWRPWMVPVARTMRVHARWRWRTEVPGTEDSVGRSSFHEVEVLQVEAQGGAVWVQFCDGERRLLPGPEVRILDRWAAATCCEAEAAEAQAMAAAAVAPPRALPSILQKFSKDTEERARLQAALGSPAAVLAAGRSVLEQVLMKPKSETNLLETPLEVLLANPELSSKARKALPQRVQEAREALANRVDRLLFVCRTGCDTPVQLRHQRREHLTAALRPRACELRAVFSPHCTRSAPEPGFPQGADHPLTTPIPAVRARAAMRGLVPAGHPAAAVLDDDSAWEGLLGQLAGRHTTGAEVRYEALCALLQLKGAPHTPQPVAETAHDRELRELPAGTTVHALWPCEESDENHGSWYEARFEGGDLIQGYTVRFGDPDLAELAPAAGVSGFCTTVLVGEHVRLPAKSPPAAESEGSAAGHWRTVEMRTCDLRGRRVSGPSSERDPHDVLKAKYQNITQRASAVRAAEEELPGLRRYIELLRAAAAKGVDGGRLEQQGFEALQALIDGAEPAPACSICLDPLGHTGPPACTRCVHLFCESCLRAHADSGQHGAAAARTGSFKCPLCREAVHPKDVIRVLPPTKRASAGAGSSSAGAGKQPALVLSAEPRNGPPQWTPCATEQGVEAQYPLPPGRLDWVPWSRAVQAVPRPLLTFLEDATGLRSIASPNQSSPAHRSSKVRVVLADVRDVMREENGTGKVVIFSQFRSAIRHLAAVLEEEGIGHVSISTGDSQDRLRSAVMRFNADPAAHCCLLQAGAAAAGLTLTVARHVMLLEPFFKAGEEQQARNRVHRIGQTRQVVCRTYYTRGSVEERLLAWRARLSKQHAAVVQAQPSVIDLTQEEGGAGEEEAALATISGDDSASVTGLSTEMLRFLLGLPPPEATAEQGMESEEAEVEARPEREDGIGDEDDEDDEDSEDGEEEMESDGDVENDEEMENAEEMYSDEDQD